MHPPIVKVRHPARILWPKGGPLHPGWGGAKASIFGQKMVLPVRIELTTSALPRMRSTTELRQHSARAAGPFRAGGALLRGSARLSTRTRPVYRPGMTDADKKARLAAALRENLRRRKAQARATAEQPAPPKPVSEP